jgi:hypothetical protein
VDIDPVIDSTPEGEPAPWWASLRTLGILMVLGSAIAFGVVTRERLEDDAVRTPEQERRFEQRITSWQQRSVIVCALGAVVLVVDGVRRKRARP